MTNKFANASRTKPKVGPHHEQEATDVAKATDTRSRGAREGKKAVSAYFSRNLSRDLNILASEQETTVQSLLGEAIDLLMVKYKKVPFGER